MWIREPCNGGPFGCADKPAEKHYWLICCEIKILFWLKNKLKSTDYKPDEQDRCLLFAWTEFHMAHGTTGECP
jgi:hypothetical protein